MIRTMIITILMILTMTTVVGCGKKEPIITNDLLHREVHKVSEISQYQ